MQTQKIGIAANSPLLLPTALNVNTNNSSSSSKPKMAMVDKKTGEVLEVVTKLTTAEEKHRQTLMARMKTYAANYVKKHPNTKPDRLKRIVSKKFNVKLT